MLAEGAFLYLFSSNQSRLYEQDILDVIAAPKGTLRQFRYFERHLSPTIKSNVSALEGRRALIHFSLQQEEEYHDPVVLPVRWASVYNAEMVGDVLMLQLTMEGWCSLPAPAGPRGFKNWEEKRDIVRAYQNWLDEHGAERPYKASAGVGPDPIVTNAPLAKTDDDALLFNYCVHYLQTTRSFVNARFYRIRAIRRLGPDNESTDVHCNSDGSFDLKGGQSYSIQVSHFQPVTPQTVDRVAVEADGKSLVAVGKLHFEITSRYDDFSVEIYAVEPPTSEVRDSVVLFEPQGAVVAPKVRLRFRILRSTARTVTAVGGAAFVAILLGVPSLFANIGPTWKTLSVALAALLTALLANAGLKRA